METQLTDTPALTFHITPETITRFTSLLQAGILVPTLRGVSIGVFLQALPGFTADYITEQVQTIFLNGTATDDLETPMDGNAPVLAISAAMPGLAGAIFRRNSLHAALRTVKNTMENSSSTDEITVTLKLFNAIARDRGIRILEDGVTIKAAHLADFLTSRPHLTEQIASANFNGKSTSSTELLKMLTTFDTIHFTLIN